MRTPETTQPSAKRSVRASVPLAVRVTHAVRHLPLAAAGAVAVLGGAILIGWALGVDLVLTGLPGYAVATPNGALCFLLMAAALGLLYPAGAGARRRTFGRFLVAGVVTICLPTLAESLLGRDLGIDRLLFGDALAATGSANPGRMALSASAAFLLLAGGVECLNPGARWRVWAGPGLSLAAALVAGAALFGYFDDVTRVYIGAGLTQMPLPTALGVLVLAVGIASGRPDQGVMRLLATRGPAGTVVRVLVPSAVVVPVLLGLLRLAGDSTGLYGTNTGVWLLVLAIIALLVPLSCALGASLDRADTERRSVEALSHRAQRDRVAFEDAPTGSVICDREGRIERVNAAFCSMLGYSPVDLVGVHFGELTVPEDRARSVALTGEISTGGGPSTGQIDKRYVHRSGHAVEASVSLSTIMDEHGDVVQFFAQVQDVTNARQTSRELEQAQFEMLARLAAAAEFHDDTSGHHTRRVGDLSVAIARRLGLPDDETDLLRLAAPLHDVGKIAIPDAVLAKPGKLTPAEFDQMKTHTTIGAEMLAGSAFALLEMAEEIALTHHERWDGSGYPTRLAGEAIPMTGRIVAVADVYDALTHARPYKAAWAASDAIAEMTRQAGRHFDPRVLDAFLDVMREAASPSVRVPTFVADVAIPEVPKPEGAPAGALVR